MSKFCTQCGAPHGEGGNFCSNCGASLEVMAAAATPEAAAPVVASGVGADSPPPPTTPPIPSGTAEPPPPTGPPIASAVAPVKANGSVADRLRQLSKLERIHLGAVVGAVVAAFVPWLRGSGESANALDVPALFLLDNEAPDRLFKLVVPIILGAAAALVALLVRTSVSRKALLVSGIVLTSIGVLFLVQLHLLLQSSFRSITDVVSVGPILLLVSGVALVFVAERRRAESQTTSDG